MRKLSVCVLFGGMSPEHEVSLRSAESVLNNMDKEQYNIFPVGITKEGDWILYTGSDYSLLPTGQWQEYPGNRRAAISPVRGQGLLSFEGDCVVRERIDVVFPARTAPCRACCKWPAFPMWAPTFPPRRCPWTRR